MSAKSPLTPIEAQFIELFVAATEVLGVPRSLGEIYGVIFASPQPASFQHIVDRLGISKGSVSQGLRMLRNFGAIRTVYLPGDRRDHFVPETELRTLVGGLLRDRIYPHLDEGRRRLEQVRTQVSEGGAAGLLRPGADGAAPAGAQVAADLDVLRARVEKLESWRKKGALVLPIITRVLG